VLPLWTQRSVAVEAEQLGFEASTAQKLGIVANELITNAFQHGASPITVHLTGGGQIRLRIEDGGRCTDGATGPDFSSSGGWSSATCPAASTSIQGVRGWAAGRPCRL